MPKKTGELKFTAHELMDTPYEKIIQLIHADMAEKGVDWTGTEYRLMTADDPTTNDMVVVWETV